MVREPPKDLGRSRSRRRGQAERENPDAVATLVAAETAADARQAASRAYRDTEKYYEQALARYGNLAHTQHGEQQLSRLDIDVDATAREFTAAQATIAGLLGEPALRTLPAARITAERETWRANRDAAAGQRRTRSAELDADLSTDLLRSHPVYEHDIPLSAPEHAPGISR